VPSARVSGGFNAQTPAKGTQAAINLIVGGALRKVLSGTPDSNFLI
jgi:hypothetical protein